MSNPPPYVPSFSFAGFQETNPTDPPPGPMLDNEFDNVADSLAQTITALSSIRRSDGALVNGIVTPESLSSDLTIGVQTPTAWVTAHAYTAGNLVVQSNKFYLCLVTHTSGVFATDLAAVKWVEVTLSITGYSADQVLYDHTISGLAAVNVKTAIDEVDAKLDTAILNTAQTLTAAQRTQARTNISAALRGQIFGMVLTNDAGDVTNDIAIAAGEVASTEANPVLMVLAASMIGQADTGTWVVGTNQPKLDTGVIGNNKYYVWVIRRSDTGVQDILFSLSSTAPTMPGVYDQKGLAGSFARVGGVNQSPRSYSEKEPTLWTPYTPLFTGLGTAASIFVQSRRVADSLQIRGKFTSGTVSGVEARMSLGYNGVEGRLTVDSTKVPTIQLAGVCAYAINAATMPTILMEGGVGTVAFGLQSSSSAGMTKITGTTFGSTVVLNFAVADIPILGW